MTDVVDVIVRDTETNKELFRAETSKAELSLTIEDYLNQGDQEDES